MNNEEWRVVERNPSYEVSSLGNVRSVDRTLTLSNGHRRFHKGQPLVISIVGGYPQVNLSRVATRVHVLVAEAFHGPRPDGMEVCHRNDIRTDNRAENLYWGTHAQNLRDASVNKRMKAGEDHPQARLTWAEVEEIRQLLTEGVYQRVIAAKYGVNQVTVSHIKRGNTWLRDQFGTDPSSR